MNFISKHWFPLAGLFLCVVTAGKLWQKIDDLNDRQVTNEARLIKIGDDLQFIKGQVDWQKK